MRQLEQLLKGGVTTYGQENPLNIYLFITNDSGFCMVVVVFRRAASADAARTDAAATPGSLALRF